MIDLTAARQQLFADLGYKPLHRGWAKLEILLGLLAIALGLLLMLGCMSSAGAGDGKSWLPKEAGTLCASVLLFVLGGYLALAGHRSHLYQSMNDRTAYLLEQIRRLDTKS